MRVVLTGNQSGIEGMQSYKCTVSGSDEKAQVILVKTYPRGSLVKLHKISFEC